MEEKNKREQQPYTTGGRGPKPVAGRSASAGPGEPLRAPISKPAPRKNRVRVVRANSMLEGSLVYPTRIRAVRTSVRNGKIFSFAMFLACAFLIYWLLNDTRFQVSSVEVVGTTGSRVPDVQAVVGSVGQNIFLVHTDDIQAQLNKVTFISQTRVQARWPARLVITISERQPSAIWQSGSGGAQFLVDQDGLLIDHPRGGEQLHVIHDEDKGIYKIGDHINNDAVLSTEVIYDTLTARTGIIIAKIEFHRECGIEVISSSGQRICFGSSAQLQAKINDLKALVDQKRTFKFANLSTPGSIVLQ